MSGGALEPPAFAELGSTAVQKFRASVTRYFFGIVNCNVDTFKNVPFLVPSLLF